MFLRQQSASICFLSPSGGRSIQMPWMRKSTRPGTLPSFFGPLEPLPDGSGVPFKDLSDLFNGVAICEQAEGFSLFGGENLAMLLNEPVIILLPPEQCEQALSYLCI